MTRRSWLEVWAMAFSAALAGCGKPKPPMDVFPESVGPWRRTSLRDLPVSESPDPVPRTSVERAQTAEYEGAGRLTARVYELSTPEAGLDVAQRWRPSADTVFFWARQYFVVVKWDETERKALQQFTTALSNRLNGK